MIHDASCGLTLALYERIRPASASPNLNDRFILDSKHEVSYTKGMNKLPSAKRAEILGMMVVGVSIRAIVRMTGVSKNTVTKLLEDWEATQNS